MSKEIIIKAVHTACKKCVFAKYENAVQTDCLLGYLDIYRDKKLEVLEVYDDELEFYVINDKKCIGYRENSWFNKFGNADSSIEEKLAMFKEMNKLDYFIVINLDAKNTEIESQMENLSLEILDLDIKPAKVLFVRYRSDALKHNYDYVINFLKKCNLNDCPWRIQTMENDDHSYERTLHNIITLNKFPRFLLSINLDKEYGIKNIINKANDIVYKQLDRFSVVSNTKENCLLFSSLLYRYSWLSEQKNILDDKENFIKV
jgi:hypothetical protein